MGWRTVSVQIAQSRGVAKLEGAALCGVGALRPAISHRGLKVSPDLAPARHPTPLIVITYFVTINKETLFSTFFAISTK